MSFFSLFSTRKQLIKVITLVSPYLRACYGDRNSYTIDEVNIGLDRCGLLGERAAEQAYAIFLSESDFNAWARSQRLSLSYQRVRSKIREKLNLEPEQVLTTQYLYQYANQSGPQGIPWDSWRFPWPSRRR
ncbi:hypothetical protein EZV61_10685 [Corallincola luteus]|uniref:Uncharacterized protein n=1 Tax=Corallincola luteus TaxID=1775177 RepID=A0ABY2ANS6_9GAMM|nr:DUF6559 family protein [Corallincola luteus]TCI03333.1 hypothetical protein EZV61_10685 [Corallincola luteus]